MAKDQKSDKDAKQDKGAKGAGKDGKTQKDKELSSEGVAFAYLMRGVHW